MRKVSDGHWMVNDTLGLIFSPDDNENNGKGWYFQRFPEQDTSQLFETKAEAMKVMESNNLKWGE